MSDNLKPELYPDSPLGDNDITETPSFNYSTELLKEAITNTTRKIEDKSINIFDDFVAIFPLSVSLTLLIVILIFIYISLF